MSKIIDEPETENWSENNLRTELLRDCGLTVGKWLFISGAIGIAAYPYLIKRLFTYSRYEIRILIDGICIVSTVAGTGYFVQKECEENVKKLYSEGRRKDLEQLKQTANKV